MDIISIFGFILGIGAIVGGQVLEGGNIASLVQPTAMLIVIGGTLGAVMLQSPLSVFVSSIKMGVWVLLPPPLSPGFRINRITRWSLMARKEGLLALEAEIEQLTDPFDQKGLRLLVDGAEPERLRDLLDVEIGAWETQLKLTARVWESAGGYSPTIGILGAVMGLIHVMENLSDPSKLGAGIAVAFVATIYGVGLANLFYLPVAKKLMTIINRMIALREMYVDGLVGIA
ncbi:MAG TPA: flagellar motor protein, partial [Rhodocyclaceae bacterium]|nr:flagellar motor protein [Rhodocyclaceae bacterium]